MISEPTTMMTDYLLGGAAIIFAVSLRSRISASRTIPLWMTGFSTAAGAAIIGGTFHGFASYQSVGLHRSLWDVTMLLIGASAAFMISAALGGTLHRHAETTRWLGAGLILSVAGLAIQIGGVSLHPDFNHNDAYHCIQTVAFYFLFRGARLM
jgi:hypothetical protein